MSATGPPPPALRPAQSRTISHPHTEDYRSLSMINSQFDGQMVEIGPMNRCSNYFVACRGEEHDIPTCED
jgi:hypothetical protein